MGERDPTLERLFKGHRGEITGLSFSPDGTKLVSSGADAKLMLWNFNKKARALSIENHSDSVTGVHFGACGKLFASCSKDRSVRVWKPSVSYCCLHTFVVMVLSKFIELLLFYMCNIISQKGEEKSL